MAAILTEISLLTKKLNTNAPPEQIKLVADTILTHLQQRKITSEEENAFCYSLIYLLKSAQELSNTEEENEVLNEAACQKFSERAAVIMNLTKNIIKHLSQTDRHLLIQLLRTCTSHMIIMCATHDTVLQWTSTTSITESKELQSVLCNACSEPSIKYLLIYENKVETQDNFISQELFSQVLKILQPKLTKATWKKHLICKHVYRWCLMQIKHPHLGQHLDMVLPPALLFTDDYQVHNKIYGIECLNHIIKEVDATELRWHNRAGVIYAAIHSQIYSNKAPLLDVVLPCILDILGVVEKSPKIADTVRKVNRYDEVLELILGNMEGEQVIAIRRLYLKNVPLFIERMGITIVRHIKVFMRIITSYLEVSDGEQEEGRLATLLLINTLIQVVGNRLTRHTEVLLKALLKLLYDSCLDGFSTSQEVTEKIQTSVIETIRNLQMCCFDVVNSNLKKVVDSEVKSVSKFTSFINDVVYA